MFLFFTVTIQVQEKKLFCQNPMFGHCWVEGMGLVTVWWRVWVWSLLGGGYGFGHCLVEGMGLVSVGWRVWVWSLLGGGYGFGHSWVEGMGLSANREIKRK